ncbi:hypothetical protein BFO_2079 [Tannerella forsythia 92A2]|uniref:Uncharacterized protein n=1 Tax=Tannerella forsythia (strain ATCC 43037 / JCM 10827 / CCUG 21028 A / KCTC 5666 / FDC 338) TaxID=203275 RepID=G8UQX7_TANFA|nr:hypothetical protein BFO_2079 [Tannerella forsythia 92A2]
MIGVDYFFRAVGQKNRRSTSFYLLLIEAFLRYGGLFSGFIGQRSFFT